MRAVANRMVGGKQYHKIRELKDIDLAYIK
jgi:hypothetical protein